MRIYCDQWHTLRPEPIPVRQASEPILLHACMLCGRMTHQDRAFGSPITKPLPPGISHRLCVECAPVWLRQCGLPEAEIAKMGVAA